ncbi:VPA1262 family protein [Aeromonas caviae]
MNSNFENLLTDPRLHDIFNGEGQACCVQVWLLEYKNKQQTLVRWLYGRAVPADYTSSCWTCPIKNKASYLTPNESIRILPFTAYISTTAMSLFTESLVQGMSLYQASGRAKIEMDEKLTSILEKVTFDMNIVRPIMHLPTRDYYQLICKRLSPSSYASYDSGAISSQNKATIFFDFGTDRARDIAQITCSALDADTGMTFASNDAWRFGDFEFLCAPSLNKSERSKYDLKTKGDVTMLQIFESFTPIPTKLIVVLKSFSDGCLQSTHIATVEKDAVLPLDLKFHVESFKNQTATAMTLEIFSQPDDSEEAFLCLHTGNHFMRRMHSNMFVIQSTKIEGKTDWLDKQVPTRAKIQLENARAIERSSQPSRSVIGGFKDDPWVELNRDIAKSVTSLLPKKSSARFFPKLSDNQGMSRLELVAWLREIFSEYHNAQIAWFDPYMEDVGIDLLHRLGSSEGDYVMFTSEKQSKIGSEVPTSEADIQGRIENLLQKCREWGSTSFGNVHLRVIALPDNKIHDRMVLIRSREGLPVAGYHLSNSIQMANENHPLLATPIPVDILPAIFSYMDDIIDATIHSQTGVVATDKVLFDSRMQSKRVLSSPTKRISLFDLQYAGDVLAWWLDIEELQSLSGTSLVTLSESLGLLEGDNLCSDSFGEIPIKLWSDGFNLQPFHGAWDVMGKLLASLPAGELYKLGSAPLSTEFELNLLRHLDPSRPESLPLPRVKREYLDLDHYFKFNLHDYLVAGNDDPHRIFSYAPSEVEYGEYYAIVLLWQRAPQELTKWLCDQTKDWSNGEKEWNGYRERQYALIITVLRHICSEPNHGSKIACIRALLSTDCAIYQWIGLHEIKYELNRSNAGLSVLDELKCLHSQVQKNVILWLIKEANYVHSDSLGILVKQFVSRISDPLSDQELKEILDMVRGRLGRLYHLTPWILEVLLVPMLEKNVITPKQVAIHWLSELTAQWLSCLKGEHLLFQTIRDGVFIDELAILFRFLKEEEQQSLITDLRKVFNKLARIIRTPMSPQLNWRRYSGAHEVNLWIYSLTKRLQVFAVTPIYTQLSSLQEECSRLIDRLSPSHRSRLSEEDLMKYSMSETEQLRSHHLLYILEKIMKDQHRYEFN